MENLKNHLIYLHYPPFALLQNEVVENEKMSDTPSK